MRKHKRLLGYGLLAVGIALVCFGVARGEQQTVLQKAIRICLECIGIG